MAEIKECSLYTFTVNGTQTKTTPKDITARAAAQAAQTAANGKQDALTAAQLAAVNSGITAEKVAGYDELKKYTLTYTSNSYVTNYAFNRFTVHKVGPHLAILNFQLSLSAAMNVSDFVTIGQISGLSLAVGSLHIVPGQHGTGTTVTVYVTTSGAIRLYSESGVAGEWYRAMIPLIIN